MTEKSLTTVEFHGATLLAQVGSSPATTLVAMKPVVDGMGLDWSYQFRKLKEHPVLSQGVAVIAMPSDGGVQSATAIPLNRLSFWLATVHPDRIKDETIRDRVIRYQIDCADALFAHFFGTNERGATPAALGSQVDLDLARFMALPLDERRERRMLVSETRETVGNITAHNLFQRVIFKTRELNGFQGSVQSLFAAPPTAVVSITLPTGGTH